jgi:hypothetical protein
MSLKKYQIYGERCSGTNILDTTLMKNFEAVNVFNEIKDITDKKFKKYGHKHWFGNHLDLRDTDDTLFICIVRDPIKWLNSFYRTPHFLKKTMVQSRNTFLNTEFRSNCYIYSKEINTVNWQVEETNIYTGKPYKNIFELRYLKLRWMYEDLPKLVKNYIFIRYEDLMEDFQGTMKKIHNKGLKKKGDITNDIKEMKKWMKRDSYKNVEESTFEFAQIDPIEKIKPWFKNTFEDFLKLDIKDYPKEYIHYEKLFGYYKL